MYIHTYMYIYIYIYIYIRPDLPTKIVPTNTAGLELSGESPMNWELHPFKLRLCLGDWAKCK